MTEYNPNIVSDVDCHNDTRSLVIKDLAMALAKAQGEFKTAGKSRENAYYKRNYADMEDVVEASRPALTKNGLSVMQQIRQNEGGSNMLHTILMHSSGQWIETRTIIAPPKTDIQTIDSYIECLKRIAYRSLVGVVSKESDDDGEVAALTTRAVVAKGVARSFKPEDARYETVSKDQLDELEYELSDPAMTEYVDDILRDNQILNLADLPKERYKNTIERVREIRRSRNGRK